MFYKTQRIFICSLYFTMMKVGKKLPKTVDEYIVTMPEYLRETLHALRDLIKSVSPSVTERIAYGIPIFSYAGRDLVGFAGYKKHYGFYVMSRKLMEEFRDEIVGYETAVATIRIPVGKPLPKALLKKIIKARMKENDELVALKKKKK